jgi:hypothetical protein
MVAGSYCSKLRVCGKLGPEPDTSLVDGHESCRRSKLPQGIAEMVFTFPRYDPRSQDEVLNFFFQRDFFVVSQSMKAFMLSWVDEADFEVRQVQVRHDTGEPADEPYFALKLIRTVDCIDADKSMTLGRLGSKSSIGPFSARMVEYGLDASLVREFATTDDGRYVSYPNLFTQSVQLKEGSIGDDAVLVQPAWWPGKLLIEAEFAQVLKRRCSGGSPGYYFWLLDLEDVEASHTRLLHELR